MTKADKQAEEIAALRKELDELKSAVKPAPAPDPKESERRNAEWQNQMHQMREKRMSMATPPSVIRDWAVLDNATVRGIVLDNRNAPTGPTGMIPNSGSGGARPSAGDGTGFVDPRPLSNPPGTNWVDAIAIADDARQRAELKRKLGGA
jgi:hypothetical protein